MPFFKLLPDKQVNICVVGDIMLDHYIMGGCERISPEAPVPIVDVTAEVYGLGGAGNVLQNLKSLGCNGSIIGICGADDAGIIMKDELERLGPAFYYLAKDTSRRTTIKTRITVSRHQLMRFDREDKHYCSDELANAILHEFKTKANDIQVLILSDYCKGVLSESLVNQLLEWCQHRNIITIVDSKHKELSKYRGATIIKPNRKEAALASGINIVDDASLEQACKKIAAMAQCQTVVVTLSEDGIAIYHEQKLTKIPTKAIEVFDVTGAGDTVVAALAFGLANKLSIAEACNFANHAAAVVVAKFGSATATVNEIENISHTS